VKNYLSWVEIDKDGLLANIAAFKRLIGPQVQFLAVVKGNAYGHGIREVSEVIKEKVDWFGVNNLEEALVLKNKGIKKPILILGYTLNSKLGEVAKNGFRQVIYNRETAIQLFKLLNYRLRVHLKVETGTNRQGVEGEELLEVARILAENPNIKIEGAYTHFANVEEEEDLSFPKKQIERFEKEIENLEKNGIRIPIKHTACTAATILAPESYFNLVRVGIGLYGLWPSELVKKITRKRKLEFDLKPVLSWKTRIVQIKEVKKGETVGYGRTYKAKKDLKIAVLPVGYYDGYDRHLSNIGRVLIRGKFAPVVGRVMMNMIIVDISHIGGDIHRRCESGTHRRCESGHIESGHIGGVKVDIGGVKVEDEVVLIGKQAKNEITAAELAEKIGTINYEVVTRINPLLRKILI
jgi:alanine racemase